MVSLERGRPGSGGDGEGLERLFIPWSMVLALLLVWIMDHLCCWDRHES